MKPTPDTKNIRWETDNLNEWVLEAASSIASDDSSPEIPFGANELPAENDPTISEQLVQAGSEEADLEQRVSETHAETEDAA